MRRQLLVLAAAAAVCASAHADYYIVVQAGSTQASMTRKEAVDLFMGRQRALRGGDFALVFDLPRDHPKRAGFYTALTGLSMAQVNSYWARLVFAGETRPPQVVPDEAAVQDVVRRNPNAIAWLTQEPTDRHLRTVLVLKEAPP